MAESPKAIHPRRCLACARSGDGRDCLHPLTDLKHLPGNPVMTIAVQTEVGAITPEANQHSLASPMTGNAVDLAHPPSGYQDGDDKGAPGRRTIRRLSWELNPGKAGQLRGQIEAFTQEKRDWLALLLQPGMLRYVAAPRLLRDDFVALGHASPYGLQARHWKLALDDAAALLNRHLCAVLKEVRRAIARHPAFGEAERNYAYWLVADYDRLGGVLLGGAPREANRELKPSAGSSLAANPKATLDRAGCHRVAAYVNRQFRSLQGHWPRIRLSRSILFDANCYSVGRTQSAGTQVLLLMGQEPRQRIALPLKGETRLSGTIRVVMDGDAIEVHAGAEVHRFQDPIPGTIQAIDLGYTEVMTDSGGHRYGQGFGAKLTAYSDQIHDAGQRRGKLRAGMDKARSRKDPKSKAKARHIKKNNLGRTKADQNKAQREATLERDVNAAINQLLRQRRPEVLVSEDLRHAFPSNQGPVWNRRLSSWVRASSRTGSPSRCPREVPVEKPSTRPMARKPVRSVDSWINGIAWATSLSASTAASRGHPTGLRP